jgi:hypothetical protein
LSRPSPPAGAANQHTGGGLCLRLHPAACPGRLSWVSTKIESGARWAGEIAKELDLDYIGVNCLTPENLDAPWILFEAGALSKGVDASRVVPYLWGLEPSDVMWPLAQFQMCRADREDTFKLLQMTDRKLGEIALRPDQLTDAFETWWPRLEERLIEIGRAPVPNAEGRRPVADMVEEMLLAVRELERRTADVQADVERLTGAPPERLLLSVCCFPRRAGGGSDRARSRSRCRSWTSRARWRWRGASGRWRSWWPIRPRRPIRGTAAWRG